MTTAPHQVTLLLHSWSKGDREALDQLLPLVYEELRRQAARYLRQERADHTLQATALIHEAYLRLVDQRSVEWQNRAHFFAIAARLMRQILVDHARRHEAAKRGGSAIKVPVEEAAASGAGRDINLVALDAALDKLAEIDAEQSRIVELRYFSGLTIEETAEVMGISAATVKREWQVAKAWLRREIKEGTEQ